MECPQRKTWFPDVWLKVGSYSYFCNSYTLFFSDSNVTFFWTATTDGHNVNFIGKHGQAGVVNGDTYFAQDYWNQCFTNSSPNQLRPGTELPSGEKFSNEPFSTPNYVHNFPEIGIYYFYCGISYPGGSHCKDGGVKARVIVVETINECPLHPNC